MKKYYYTDGKQKFGPYSIDELLEKNIDNDSLIWYEGLPDWAPLSSFPELKLKTFVQPPPLKFKENRNVKTKINTKFIASIIFGLFVIAIGIYVYPKIENKKKFEQALEVFKKKDSISYGIFKELSEKDYPKAHFILGLYYERLDDTISAKKMFEKALIVDRDIPAYFWLVSYYGLSSKGGKDSPADFKTPFYKGLENWVNTIEPTDWLGQITAARIYFKGKMDGEFKILATENGKELSSYDEFFKIKNKKAVNYLELAAKNGSVEGMYYLGDYLEDKDLDKAIFWHKKAAELGYSNAMFSLAKIYNYKPGQLVPNEEMSKKRADKDEAKKWYSLLIKSNSDAGYRCMGDA